MMSTPPLPGGAVTRDERVVPRDQARGGPAGPPSGSGKTVMPVLSAPSGAQGAARRSLTSELLLVETSHGGGVRRGDVEPPGWENFSRQGSVYTVHIRHVHTVYATGG